MKSCKTITGLYYLCVVLMFICLLWFAVEKGFYTKPLCYRLISFEERWENQITSLCLKCFFVCLFDIHVCAKCNLITQDVKQSCLTEHTTWKCFSFFSFEHKPSIVLLQLTHLVKILSTDTIPSSSYMMNPSNVQDPAWKMVGSFLFWAFFVESNFCDYLTILSFWHAAPCLIH